VPVAVVATPDEDVRSLAAGSWLAWTQFDSQTTAALCAPRQRSDAEAELAGDAGERDRPLRLAVAYTISDEQGEGIETLDLVQGTRRRITPPQQLGIVRAMSGEWLLLEAIGRCASHKLFLFNLRSQTRIILDLVACTGAFLAEAVLNGRYVAWTHCEPDTSSDGDLCQVLRYDRHTRETIQVPNFSRRSQHTPALAPDGTVIVVRDGAGECRSPSAVFVYPSGWYQQQIAVASLPNGKIVRSAAVALNKRQASLYYELRPCDTDSGSDIYRLDVRF
jgi:hypothetical protein